MKNLLLLVLMFNAAVILIAVIKYKLMYRKCSRCGKPKNKCVELYCDSNNNIICESCYIDSLAPYKIE